MPANLFTEFEQARIEESALEQLKQTVENTGFSAFRQLLEGLQQRIKSYADEEKHQVSELVHKAEQLFPTPGSFSPSWIHVWQELKQTIAHKNRVLDTVSLEDRDGEWQIILDNPYTNQQVACYPALSFMEGAYLYAYFRIDLKRNEYVRLQKVQTLVMDYGDES